MPNSKLFNHFTSSPVNLEMKRSMFDLSKSHKTSFNLGECIPLFASAVLPGDTWNIDTTSVIRVQPLVTPVMDSIVFDRYWFFVPYRLVWSHFVNFMGENTENAWIPQVNYTVPQTEIPSGGFDVGTIADYLGIPPKQGGGTTVSSLWLRAYALIMGQWFRDQNLQDAPHVTLDETTITGVNTGDQVTDIEKGGKPFIACRLSDAFSTALPSPQKGPAVTFDLAGYAPVLPNASLENFSVGDERPTGLSPVHVLTVDSNNKFAKPSVGAVAVNAVSGDSYGYIRSYGSPSGSTPNQYLYPNNLYADMSAITQFSINELRTAISIQRYYEKLALSGSRYIEQILSFYGVRSSDARMQRSEYLGGGRHYLNISQVENVSNQTTNVDPIGSVAGLSVTGESGSDVLWSAEEFGVIMCIGVARIQHSYQNGLDPEWTRKTLFDFYNPVFANIGNVGIRNDTIYLGTSANINKQIFGYQEAWWSYRYSPNSISGEMRSNAITSLDIWHFADDYNSLPSLGSSWITEDKSLLDRALAVTSSVSNQFIADFYFNIKCARVMPTYSIPSIISRM